jgi:hypothetical protein
MGEIVIFYSTVEASIGEEKFYFTGVGMSVDVAHQRAIDRMHEDEYLKCVHYQITRVCYGIL